MAGDWLTTIGPSMRDLSPSSSAWWDEVLKAAGAAYQTWLGSSPMDKLKVEASSPAEFGRMPWLRVEQRAQVALLKALPEGLRQEVVSSRNIGSIPIVFHVLKLYQPGGLGERTMLLKQLVDQKVPTQVQDWLQSLRAWRRWLVRVGELGIQAPDPVLLMSTLDRYASALARNDGQVAFRLQVARAGLRVDVAPSVAGVGQFAEVLLAEGVRSTTAAATCQRPRMSR